MNMAGPDLPLTISSHLQDLERRIRVLETSARVPNISTLSGGMQAVTTTTIGEISQYLGEEEWLTFPGAPELTIEVPQTGRVLMMMSVEPVVGLGEFQALFLSMELDGPTHVPADASWAVWQYSLGGGERRNRFWVFEGLESGTYEARILGMYPVDRPDFAVVESLTVMMIPL